jgi:hypothetical protein
MEYFDSDTELEFYKTQDELEQSDVIAEIRKILNKRLIYDKCIFIYNLMLELTEDMSNSELIAKLKQVDEYTK